MAWHEHCDSVCPIARTLGVVGDRWTLLIMREISMGNRRYEEMQAQLGMSSHLLSSRLKRMEKDGIIERRLYNSHPERFEYVSTDKGRDLDVMLLNLRAWGMKWGGLEPETEPAVQLVHRKSGEIIGPDWDVPHDFHFVDTESTVGAAFVAERQRKKATFFEEKQKRRGKS